MAFSPSLPQHSAFFTDPSGNDGGTMSEISRRLTTILAADVTGYSRLAGADEDRAWQRTALSSEPCQAKSNRCTQNGFNGSERQGTDIEIREDYLSQWKYQCCYQQRAKHLYKDLTSHFSPLFSDGQHTDQRPRQCIC